MSLLVWVDVVISLDFSKDSILKILRHGEQLGWQYKKLESNQILTVQEAAKLAIDRLDPNWIEGILDVKLPDVEYPFSILFWPEDKQMSVSFTGFNYKAKSPLYYEFNNADFAPYVDLLLKLVEPYVLLSIDVGSMR